MTNIESPHPKLPTPPQEGARRLAVEGGPAKKLRRDEIVDEATRLFAERGYEGASMADLAERVGLRKASLFHHFASKDVLYAAVLERLLGPVSEAISRAVGKDLSYAERLDALSDAMTEVLHRQPFAARLFVREAMDWGPVIREKLSSSIQGSLLAAVQFVKAGQDAGVFVEGDPRQLIMSVLGVHFMPFLIPNVTEGFCGVNPYDGAFLDARRAAVREHVRGVALRRKT